MNDLEPENRLSGFRENEHTADWELEVWAPDLRELLEQAARGMYTLSGIMLAGNEAERKVRSLNISAPDEEMLLVSFLEELLFFGESERIAFDGFDIHLDGYHLSATLSGAPIGEQSKEIKAVTYHNLAVRRSQRGLEANIVFDV